MNSELHVRHFTALEAEPLVEKLIAVHREVYAGKHRSPYSEEQFREQVNNHMLVPGWTLVTAYKGQHFVGYIYGLPLTEKTRWWEGMRTQMPADFTLENGKRTFAISELMVREPWRRQGIARALHDEILAHRPEERATLLANPDNEAGQAAYSSWGWQKVAKLQPEGRSVYDVFIKLLR